MGSKIGAALGLFPAARNTGQTRFTNFSVYDPTAGLSAQFQRQGSAVPNW